MSINSDRQSFESRCRDLTEALARHSQLSRYAKLPMIEAANLAWNDFQKTPDHEGHRPLNSDHVCKTDATDFFRLASTRCPELVTGDMINDFKRLFFEGNPATQINILRIAGTLQIKSWNPFLASILKDERMDSWVRQEITKTISMIEDKRTN